MSNHAMSLYKQQNLTRRFLTCVPHNDIACDGSCVIPWALAYATTNGRC